jgi:Xaa-Pro aminopeptidase
MASYAERMTRFRELIAGRADLVFVPIGTDLDYLTGLHRDIPNWGRNLHPGMWTEGAWITADQEPILTLPRMTAEFGATKGAAGMDVRVLGDWDDPVAMAAGILKELGVGEGARIATSDDAEAESLMELQRLVPEAQFVSATRILRELRVIKDADEIATMREAGRMTEAAFAEVVKQLKVGMTELEIVSEVDFQMRRQGSLGPSFTTSLYNTGPNHPMLFGRRLQSWPRVLTAPVSVLFDFGAVHDGMCYDFGRTVSFGAPSEEQVRVHRLIMESQRAGIAALKAGEVTCEEVDRVARAVIEDAGYGSKFRHRPRPRHRLGRATSQPFLTKGDTTTVREGHDLHHRALDLPGRHFSARVEDCIVARPGGGEPLTTGWQDLVVVE